MSFAQSPFVAFQPTRFHPAAQAAPQPPAPASPDACPVCPKLPSSDSAYLFTQGDPTAPWLMLRDFIGRSVLVGSGMYLAGEREHLVRNSLAGGAAIEFFVVLWIWWTTRQAPQPVYVVPTPPPTSFAR